jgi:hypothetical protein
MAEPKHGTHSCYVNRLCRCEPCKAANQKRNREWYQKNRKSVIERTRQWTAKNQDKVRSNHREYNLLTKYGMTVADYNQLLEDQEHRCKICGQFAEQLCVDHDHESGQVRGLLCNQCNTGIGKLQESVFVLESAIVYLEVSSNR